ncbi:MAG: hypothetical protein OXD43_09215 [Bacteroidetes bacterium]|nr:hypothetical protein [Bacteroidota bacterium]
MKRLTLLLALSVSVCLAPLATMHPRHFTETSTNYDIGTPSEVTIGEDMLYMVGSKYMITYKMVTPRNEPLTKVVPADTVLYDRFATSLKYTGKSESRVKLLYHEFFRNDEGRMLIRDARSLLAPVNRWDTIPYGAVRPGTLFSPCRITVTGSNRFVNQPNLIHNGPLLRKRRRTRRRRTRGAHKGVCMVA